MEGNSLHETVCRRHRRIAYRSIVTIAHIQNGSSPEGVSLPPTSRGRDHALRAHSDEYFGHFTHFATSLFS